MADARVSPHKCILIQITDIGPNAQTIGTIIIYTKTSSGFQCLYIIVSVLSVFVMQVVNRFSNWHIKVGIQDFSAHSMGGDVLY